MDNRISLITIGVGDFDRARDFYTSGLGWIPAFEADEVVFFQLNGIIAGLFRLDDLARESGRPRTELGTGGLALAFNCRSRTEVDTVLAQAAAAGAHLPEPAQDRPWGGYSGYFVDPEGHTWEIAWNPGFEIDAEGNTTIGAPTDTNAAD